MYLTARPLHGSGLIPGRGGEFQGIFSWLITSTWRGDGRRQIVTSPLKRYEEYEAIQLFCLQVPLIIKMVMGL